jgi:hypothetical protein
MPLATEPIDIALDADGDFDIVDGDARFVSGGEAVKQLINIALAMFQGEWFLDLDAGMPYYQDILGRKYADEATIRAAVRTAILGVDGVSEIVKLEIAWNGAARSATIAWRVKTEFGDTAEDTLEV